MTQRTPEEAHAEAIARIQAAKASGQTWLDLGDLGLEEIPAEIGCLDELEILALGATKIVPAFGGIDFEWDDDRVSQIIDISAIQSLTSLRLLDLDGCLNVCDLTPLESLTTLQSLSLHGCERISDLTPLQALSDLRSLNLFECRELTDLAPLQALAALESLSLIRCHHVTDLKPLQSLAALQSLDLRWCRGVRDLTPLWSLTDLESLVLDKYSRIVDLTPIQSLTALRSLDLGGCRDIATLTPLQSLTSLQSLNLGGCVSVSNLAPLQTLITLQSLSLYGCEHLSDLAPLQALTALQSLSLDGCECISDLIPLHTLTNLQRLDLDGCRNVSDLTPLQSLTTLQSLDLRGCESVTDLSPLQSLTELRSLNLGGCGGVTDLTPLQRLTALQSLNLGECESVTCLSPLRTLTALQSLHLPRCQGVTNLAPLVHLKELRSLELSGIRSQATFREIVPLLSQLKSLRLYNSEWNDLPKTLCGQNPVENVLRLVRAHFADLNHGKQLDTERKVLILGNGGVGKTQLARRLQGLPFNPSISTTHGIELGSTSVSLSTSEEPVSLHLWDFGGQDIYHGAHSLFLQREAIYLILWNPNYETGIQVEDGLEMQHRPLTYWLDFIHSVAGHDAPILVIQTQCDRASDRVSRPPANLDRFLYNRILACSAATNQGIKAVFVELEDALKYLLEQRGFDEIGVGRVSVRQRLRALLAEDQSRHRRDQQNHTLTVNQFTLLCQEVGGVSDPMALLDLLHNTGVVYYRKNVMRDRLVLNQNWALEGIYSLFHRQKTLPTLKKLGGKFTRSDLDCMIWGDYSVEEQNLFLEVMQACGMCFPTRQIQHDEGLIQEFIAPDLLPENPESKHLVLSHLTVSADAEVEILFPFMHEGILRSLLSGIGRQIGRNGVFWRYGCWFYEGKRNSELVLECEKDLHLLANANSGTLRLRAWKGASTELIKSILEMVESLRMGQPPSVRWLAGLPGAGMDRQTVIPIERDPTTEPSHVFPLQGSSAPVQEAKPRPEIFISYAWGNDKSPEGIERQQTVDQLEAKLREWDYVPIRDTNVLRNGDSISAFMARISKGDRVVVILSGAYLQSEACMTEVNGLFASAHRDRSKFLQRIIPLVLSDAKISRPKDRADHAKFWHAKKVEMHADFDFLGSADKQRLCMISDWAHQIGDILAFISDELHPHGYEQIITNDFAGVQQLIARKVAGE